jgi:N-acetylneuraminate synthase
VTRTQNVFVIAEAGVNHNGSLDVALRLVEAAAAADANAVKFQTFKTEELVTSTAPRANYQVRTLGGSETQFEMLKRLELSAEDHAILKGRCDELNIEFMSTPFDIVSAEFLARKMGVRRIKISSGDVTNGPFLLEICHLGLPIILSTGMSALSEIDEAIAVLAHGFLRCDGPPTRGAWESAAGRAAVSDKLTLLHCTSDYPAKFDETNLRAMTTMAKRFGLPVGLSDHTLGITVPVAAVARGACTIEKHFTLDRSLPGPDHAASLEPQEFRDMVDGIRIVELALGSDEKRATVSEMRNIPIVRRSLVAARHIRAGEILRSDDIVTRRPGTGLSPMRYWELVGRRASRDFQEGECLDF